jgi:hypothetical protein
MGKANPAGSRSPGISSDIMVAALLAIGAFTEGLSRSRRAWLTAIPIIAVNAVAFYGQLAYLHTHLAAPDAIRVLVALTLESIAVYLAWMAHLALIADDSALRIRLAAYGMAVLIAVLNYSHYMRPGWRPTATAVIFGLCSVISPGLWSVYSRREARDRLKASGLIEAHAVRLGATRWAWHLYRCVRVMWAASWEGETDPGKVIALLGHSGRQERRREIASRAEKASGAPVPLPSKVAGGAGTSSRAVLQGQDGPGTKPPPVPSREDHSLVPSRGARRAPGRAAAATEAGGIDVALLKELLTSGKPLPSVRKLSLEKAGIRRSRMVERTLEEARHRLNGGADHAAADR